MWPVGEIFRMGILNIDPMLPCPTSARHGSYPGISRRPRRWSTTGEADSSETCGTVDFCSAHWALSPVSLLAIFCFDDGSRLPNSVAFERGRQCGDVIS